MVCECVCVCACDPRGFEKAIKWLLNTINVGKLRETWGFFLETSENLGKPESPSSLAHQTSHRQPASKQANKPASQPASQPTSQPSSQPSGQPANWLSIEVGMARLIPASQIATKPAKIDDRNRRPENGVIAPYLGTLSSVFCRGLGSGSSSEIPHALFPFPTRIRIGIRIRIRIRTWSSSRSGSGSG